MSDPDVELWAMNEVKDPVSLHHPAWKHVGFYVAVRLSDGRLHYRRETGRFDAKTCWDLLQSRWRACRNCPDRVVAILDDAKLHHAPLHQAWRADVTPGFELDFLLR